MKLIERGKLMLVVYVLCALVAIALTYPVAILVTLRSSRADALRWIQNSPSFCIFAIFILPVAAWLIAPDILLFEQQVNGVWQWVSSVILVILLAIVFFGVRSSVMIESHAGPFSGERLKVEDRLVSENSAREDVRRLMLQLRETTDSDSINKLKEEIKKIKTDHFKNRGSFTGVIDMFRRGTIADMSAYLVNLSCVGFAAVIVWHVFNVLALQLPTPSEKLLLAVGLVVLWFPMRLYAEWYNNFYSMDSFNGYYIGIALIEATAIVYVMLVIRENPHVGVQVFSIAITGIFGLGLALGKIKPQWLVSMADVIEGTPFGWWLAYIAIALVGGVGSITLLLKQVGNA